MIIYVVIWNIGIEKKKKLECSQIGIFMPDMNFHKAKLGVKWR